MELGGFVEGLWRPLGEIDEAAGDYGSAIDNCRAAMAMEEPGAALYRDVGRALRKAGFSR